MDYNLTFQQLTMITKKLITAKQPYYRCSICKSGENNSKKRKRSTCHMPRGPPLNGVNKLQMHNQYKKNMFVISYHRQTWRNISNTIVQDYIGQLPGPRGLA